MQARRDGPHAAPQVRERPSEELPPNCSMYHGFPAASSPFVQAYLPAGFRYENRKSRCCCYRDPNGPARGTDRSKDAAVRSVVSWTWLWWDSLAPEQQEQLRNSNPARPAEPAPKRHRAS